MQKNGLDIMAGSMFQMELIECFFKADLPNMQTKKASVQIRINGRMQKAIIGTGCRLSMSSKPSVYNIYTITHSERLI